MAIGFKKDSKVGFENLEQWAMNYPSARVPRLIVSLLIAGLCILMFINYNTSLLSVRALRLH